VTKDVVRTTDPERCRPTQPLAFRKDQKGAGSKTGERGERTCFPAQGNLGGWWGVVYVNHGLTKGKDKKRGATGWY